MSTERVVTASTDSSSTPAKLSAEATRKRQRSATPRSATSRRQCSRSVSETSLKMTRPPSPTIETAPRAIRPDPHPTSSRTSPGLRPAFARTRSRVGCMGSRSFSGRSTQRAQGSARSAMQRSLEEAELLVGRLGRDGGGNRRERNDGRGSGRRYLRGQKRGNAREILLERLQHRGRVER